MGILDFLKKKDSPVNSTDIDFANDTQNESIIDRNLFVKEPNSSENRIVEETTAWKNIFNRMRKDYELEGYNDALSTPDVKYRDDNAEILKLNLGIDITEAEIEIKEYLKELEFHINSRKKADLLDLVEELESKKFVFDERLNKLQELKSDLANNTGNPQRILLAYYRGFNKGLAALTVANIINKRI